MLAAIGSILAALVLVVLALVVVRSRELRARSRRISADPLEPASGHPPIAQARATHLRTIAGRPASDACLPELPARVDGALAVSDLEITFDRMHVPLARVRDAAFLREFEGISGESAGGVLRITWWRGGEWLQSVFRVEGRRVDGERLRKEIHLRAGKAPPPPGIGP